MRCAGAVGAGVFGDRTVGIGALAATNNHRQSFQLRVAKQLDGREKRVHVEMRNAPHGGLR